jgi:hypothetical protein
MLKNFLIMSQLSFGIKKIIFFLIIFLFSAANYAQTALEFNGVNNYVEVPYSPVNNPGQFTIEHWVRLDGGTDTFRASLASRNYIGDSLLSMVGYTFYANSTNNWSLWADTKVLSGPAVTYVEWTHLAGTYDGTTIRFYVNGILVDSVESAFAPNTDIPLRIGSGRTENIPAYYFPGIIDEVRIWDVARTETEINSVISRSLSLPQTGLVSYFTLDDGLATNAIGAGNDGTLINSPTPVFTTAPTTVSGNTSICTGESTILTSSGGNLSSEGVDVWYEGSCGGDAFHQGWETQPYPTRETRVNPYQ